MRNSIFLTDISLFLTVIFMIMFTLLYLQGNDLIKTKCEIVEKSSSESCTYSPCSHSRCEDIKSTRYKLKYLIHEINEGTCNNKTFLKWSICKKPIRYSIGNKRTCYVNKYCNDETFFNDYLIGTWIMLTFVCLCFICYWIGIYIETS